MSARRLWRGCENGGGYGAFAEKIHHQAVSDWHWANIYLQCQTAIAAEVRYDLDRADRLKATAKLPNSDASEAITQMLKEPYPPKETNE